MTTNRFLLIIPDISGFTEFVNTTEINHSQHIISELLELLIDSNELGMTVSEVEGDAILFFKKDPYPELNQIISQARTMFINFHNHLKKYESQRICNCGACSTAYKLSLKMIAHSGELGFIKVKGFQKPHGHNVILVHRLLKNNIENDEYLLLTEPLFEGWKNPELNGIAEWVEFKDGASTYEDLAKVDYKSISLSPLHRYVEEPAPVAIFSMMDKPLVGEIMINRPIEEVFEMVCNFENRLLWYKGIDHLVFKKNRVNRIGSTHQCLIGKNKLEFETVTGNFDPNSKVYGERTMQAPLAKEVVFYYILNEEGKSTRLRFECHYETQPPLQGLKSALFQLTFRRRIPRQLWSLKEACEKER